MANHFVTITWIAYEIAHLSGVASVLVRSGSSWGRCHDRLNPRQWGLTCDLGPIKWWRYLSADEMAVVLQKLLPTFWLSIEIPSEHEHPGNNDVTC